MIVGRRRIRVLDETTQRGAPHYALLVESSHGHVGAKFDCLVCVTAPVGQGVDRHLKWESNQVNRTRLDSDWLGSIKRSNDGLEMCDQGYQWIKQTHFKYSGRHQVNDAFYCKYICAYSIFCVLAIDPQQLSWSNIEFFAEVIVASWTICITQFGHVTLLDTPNIERYKVTNIFCQITPNQN